MQLSETDLHDLAAFLARRMTTSFAPIDPADAPLPGVSTSDAWMAVLREAQAGGWLPALVKQITAARPHDATLAEACRLLTPRAPHRESVLAGVVFAGGVLGMGTLSLVGVAVAGALLAFDAAQSASPSQIASTSEEVISVAMITEGLPVMGDDRLGAVALDESAADPDGDHQAADSVSRVEDGPPESIPEPGVNSLATHDGGHDKCPGRPGEAVGYWYAGRHSPGSVGDTVVLDRSINVRAQYPHADNGWNKGARIRCVLRPGDRATLSASPVELPGGHFWVPVFPGDVVEERPTLEAHWAPVGADLVAG